MRVVRSEPQAASERESKASIAARKMAPITHPVLLNAPLSSKSGSTRWQERY
jgi:hypothetical protein